MALKIQKWETLIQNQSLKMEIAMYPNMVIYGVLAAFKHYISSDLQIGASQVLTFKNGKHLHFQLTGTT